MSGCFFRRLAMHCIAVFALKGGVGKSAITVFLADSLSSIFNQRVLVVDLDPQQSSTIALLGEDRLLIRTPTNGQSTTPAAEQPRSHCQEAGSFRAWEVGIALVVSL